MDSNGSRDISTADARRALEISIYRHTPRQRPIAQLSGPDMSEHRTEVDGWLALWQLDRHGTRILLVRNLSSSHTLMSATSPTAAPDLAEVRDRFPELSRLWDALRHEYWTAFIAPQANSCRTIRTEGTCGGFRYGH